MGSFYAHRFTMPELNFMLLVGQSIPKKLTDFCFVRGKGHPLLYGTLLESLILADARDLLAQSR